MKNASIAKAIGTNLKRVSRFIEFEAKCVFLAEHSLILCHHNLGLQDIDCVAKRSRVCFRGWYRCFHTATYHGVTTACTGCTEFSKR